MDTRGWADPQVKAIADRSSALLRQLDPFSARKIPALWSLFAYHHTASHRRAAREVAQELVAVADGSGDGGLRAAAETILGIALHPEGQIAKARHALERAIQFYDPKIHRDQGAQIGLDSLVLAKTLLAHLHWFSGDSKSAFTLVSSALEWAREVAHVPSIAIGLLYGCQVHQFAGDRGTTAAMTSEILTLASKYGLPAYEGYAAIIHAWATRDDQRADAVLNVLSAMGCKLCLSYYSSLVADNLAERGDIDAAVERIDHCLSLCRENDERYYEPELLRRRGMYLLQTDRAPSDAIRHSLEQAAKLARERDLPRTEALATGELLRRFGNELTHWTRLKHLLAVHPGLREIEINHPTGAVA
jgi:hypothetical protein